MQPITSPTTAKPHASTPTWPGTESKLLRTAEERPRSILANAAGGRPCPSQSVVIEIAPPDHAAERTLPPPQNRPRSAAGGLGGARDSEQGLGTVRQAQVSPTVDESGIDLGMEGGKVRSSVNLRWISRKHLTQSSRGRKLSINRKRYGSSAKGEGSPQGSPEHLVQDPNRQRRGGRTSALRRAFRGAHEGSGAGRAARFPVVRQEGEPPRG